MQCHRRPLPYALRAAPTAAEFFFCRTPPRAPFAPSRRKPTLLHGLGFKSSMSFPRYWPYDRPPEFVQCVRSFAEAHLFRQLHDSAFTIKQPLAPPCVRSHWYVPSRVISEAAPPKKRGDGWLEVQLSRRRLQITAARSCSWRSGRVCVWAQRASSRSCLKGFLLAAGFKGAMPASSHDSRCSARVRHACAHAPTRRCARGRVLLILLRLLLLW
jgi:hypothetical protein